MKRWLKIILITLVIAIVLIGGLIWHYDTHDRIVKEFEQVKACFGWSNAQYRLGYMHRYGINVPRNDAIAVKFLTKAAQQRHIKAQSLLGVMYFRGLGTPKDRVKGCAWMMLAHYQAVVPEDRKFCEQGLRVMQGALNKGEIAEAKDLCISLHKQIFPQPTH